jgi:O-antigen/teichoic acid export membrane protein
MPIVKMAAMLTGGVVRHFGRAVKLATLAITGQFVAYLLSIILARRLGVEGFEAYVVASAAFTLMIMFAPRGIDKYALRLLPVLFERGDWGRARGFLQFGVREVLLTSLVVATVVGLWVLYFSEVPRATKIAIGVSCLSLPAGALVHYGVEALSANGRLILSTAIFRVAVPTMTLILAGFMLLLMQEPSGAMAVGCWGVAWALALVVMVVALHRTAPPEVRRADPTEEARAWRLAAIPFWVYRFSLALVSQAAVIALDALQPSASAVGAYAAAIATANLPLVLVTSTNRYYSRELAILLEQRDFAGVLNLRNDRLRWLLPIIVLFLALVFGFGREIMSIFRPEFVDEGVNALQLLAIATAVSMLFSLAPTYLKYVGHNRSTLVSVACVAVLQIFLLVLFVPRYAATGAAMAYAISICGLYLFYARMANRELLTLRANNKQE